MVFFEECHCSIEASFVFQSCVYNFWAWNETIKNLLGVPFYIFPQNTWISNHHRATEHDNIRRPVDDGVFKSKREVSCKLIPYRVILWDIVGLLTPSFFERST